MSFATRRRVLLWSSALLASGIAGCTGDDDDDSETGDDDVEDDDSSEQMSGTDDDTELVCPPTTNSESRQLLPELDGYTERDTVETAARTDLVSRLYDGPDGELYVVQVEIYGSESDAEETEPRAFGRRIEQDGVTVEPEEMLLGRRGAVTMEVLGDDGDRIEALYQAAECFDESAVVGRTWVSDS